jgi:hypothetical protein
MKRPFGPGWKMGFIKPANGRALNVPMESKIQANAVLGAI